MIDFLVSCSGGRKTVVTATHDLDLVEDIADYCHVFQRGRSSRRARRQRY